MREWHQKYSSSGLVIIANHFPEFSYEKDLGNLTAAVKQLNIEYIIAQDNDGKTWRAYNNHYWPTLYIIDKNGFIRYKHIGEGAYEETESVIVELLALQYP